MVDLITREDPIKARARRAMAQKEQNEQIQDEIRRAKKQMIEVKIFQGEAQRIQNKRRTKQRMISKHNMLNAHNQVKVGW